MCCAGAFHFTRQLSDGSGPSCCTEMVPDSRIDSTRQTKRSVNVTARLMMKVQTLYTAFDRFARRNRTVPSTHRLHLDETIHGYSRAGPVKIKRRLATTTATLLATASTMTTTKPMMTTSSVLTQNTSRCHYSSSAQFLLNSYFAYLQLSASAQFLLKIHV